MTLPRPGQPLCGPCMKFAIYDFAAQEFVCPECGHRLALDEIVIDAEVVRP